MLDRMMTSATYPAETRGMALLYGENCIILTSNAFDWSTRVTDGQTELQWHIRVIAYMLSRVKTAWNINTKLGTHVLYGRVSACIDPKVKRSKGQVHRVMKCPTGVGMHVDTTA